MNSTLKLVMAVTAAFTLDAARSDVAGSPLHVHLSKSEPMADSTVTVAPTTVKLWFSAPVQVAVTTVRVSATDGTSMSALPVQRATGDNAPLVATLPSPLANGRYSVAWRTMSRDGHAVAGTFAFTVAASATNSN